jgi:hypothetical protein
MEWWVMPSSPVGLRAFRSVEGVGWDAEPALVVQRVNDQGANIVAVRTLVKAE